jgi:hypothetical protein
MIDRRIDAEIISKNLILETTPFLKIKNNKAPIITGTKINQLAEIRKISIAINISRCRDLVFRR